MADDETFPVVGTKFAILPCWVMALGLHEAMVYAALASYANAESRRCWPSAKSIAERSHLGERIVRRTIHALEAAGAIEILLRHRSDGGRTSNGYILFTDPPAYRAGGGMQDVQGAPAPDAGHELEPVELEDGSSTRPFDDVLELRNSERTVEADPKASVARNARAKNETRGSRSAEAICLRLASRIEENGCRRPKITATWLKEARLLVDNDDVPPDEVLAAIDWATSHHFWKTNILSMPTLRRQFDRLRMQAQAEREGGSVKQREHNAAQESIRRLIEEEDAKERGVLA